MFIFTLFRRSIRLMGFGGILAMVVVYLMATTPEVAQRMRNAVEHASTAFHFWSESSDLQNAKQKLVESSDAVQELKANRETLLTQLAALQSRHSKLIERLASQRRQLGQRLLSDGSAEPLSGVVDGLDKYRHLAASVARIEAAIDEGSQSVGQLDSKIAAAENANDDAEIRLASREVIFVARDALARGDNLLQSTTAEEQ